jgi:molybdenum cofactor biosynthesis enzyme MoaA
LLGRPYLFEALIIAHVERCNLRCNYCYQFHPNYDRTKPKQTYMALDLIRELLERHVINPRGLAFWGGGEPTCGDDFEDIVELLSASGFSQILNTNAVRMSPAVVKALSADMRFGLVCSVDAGTPETYSRVKGANAYRLVMENLAIYAATGGNVAVKYIILPDNEDEVLTFADQALAIGIRKYQIDFDNGCCGREPTCPDSVFVAAETFVSHLRNQGAEVSWTGNCRPRFSPAQAKRVDSWFMLSS